MVRDRYPGYRIQPGAGGDSVSSPRVLSEDREQLDYVRQALDRTPRHKSKPHCARDGRMIGHIGLGAAEAGPDSGLYRRRVFFPLPTTGTPTASTGRARPARPSPPDHRAPPRGREDPRFQQGSSSAMTTSAPERCP
ncbi:DUF6009 family protein [Streptomyces sp. MMS24-I29]|uniref:DUF6009 family protein n=1 Tax=Streptomyces sp. MMS24-I29 TaxID=3351480 RepID=UPI003C7CFBBF